MYFSNLEPLGDKGIKTTTTKQKQTNKQKTLKMFQNTGAQRHLKFMDLCNSITPHFINSKMQINFMYKHL